MNCPRVPRLIQKYLEQSLGMCTLMVLGDLTILLLQKNGLFGAQEDGLYIIYLSDIFRMSTSSIKNNLTFISLYLFSHFNSEPLSMSLE